MLIIIEIILLMLIHSIKQWRMQSENKVIITKTQALTPGIKLCISLTEPELRQQIIIIHIALKATPPEKSLMIQSNITTFILHREKERKERIMTLYHI